MPPVYIIKAYQKSAGNLELDFCIGQIYSASLQRWRLYPPYLRLI